MSIETAGWTIPTPADLWQGAKARLARPEAVEAPAPAEPVTPRWRLVWDGHRGAWAAYRAWLDGTERDAALDLADDGQKRIIADDRKAALQKERRQVRANVLRVMLAIGTGGWWPLSLAYAAAAGLSWYLMGEVAGKDEHAKARAVSSFKAGLAAALLSILIGIADWKLGIADWSWSPVYLWWPVLLFGLAYGWLLKASWNGTVADDLEELAPKDPEMQEAKPDNIEAAVIASVKGLDPESKPRVVEPGIAWTADRSVWTATVDTGGPSGRRVIAGAEDIAARLGLGLGRLHMLIDEDRGSRVRMTGVVADPWGPSTRSPLMGMERVDLWEPIPFGRDIEKTSVTLTIPGSNFLFGGMPNYGKSTAASNLWGAFILSERSRLWVIDGGEVDTEPLHRAGLTHRWCTDPAEAVEILREWNAEIDRRQAQLARMGKRRADREFFTELGIAHDLLSWDEVASYTDSADRKLAAEITRLGKSALQRCRKAGMVMQLATQSPSASALDSDARDTIHWRWAGWCRTREMSDKIMGAGSAARGVDASQLDRRVKGAGRLSTAEGERIVRPHYLDDDDQAALIAKAVRLRGLEDRPVPAELLAMADLMAERASDWISADDLIASGGVFADHDPVSLAATVRDLGVRTGKVRELNGARRYRLEDVQEAIRRAS